VLCYSAESHLYHSHHSDSTLTKNRHIEQLNVVIIFNLLQYSKMNRVVAFGDDMKKEFVLEPGSTFVNHASFGAAPRRVLNYRLRYVSMQSAIDSSRPTFLEVSSLQNLYACTEMCERNVFKGQKVSQPKEYYKYHVALIKGRIKRCITSIRLSVRLSRAVEFDLLESEICRNVNFSGNHAIVTCGGANFRPKGHRSRSWEQNVKFFTANFSRISS